MLDLTPATDALAEVVRNVADGPLDGPTPCAAYTVGDLLDHISGFPLAFAAAAIKEPLDRGASGSATALMPDWRDEIPARLQAMADAWKDPAAFEGMTAAGGVDLPGPVAAVVALDETVVHAWDLAVATGQPYEYDGPGLDALIESARQIQGNGIEGIFGPPLYVGDHASPFEELLGLTGRDPAWQP